MSESPSQNDPLIELAELSASLRAHLAWQAETGASGLPRASSLPRSMDLASTPVSEPYSSVLRAHHEAARPVAIAEPVAPPAYGADPPSVSAAAPVSAPHAPASAAAPVSAPRASIEDVRTRLALLAEEARTCSRCGLCQGRQQAVFSRGDPAAELCFVGEGPGADEDRLGEPFVGAAGQLLDKMIAAMGYARDAVYICNIVKCRPPNNRKPEPAEMKACSPFVTQQIDLIRPKVIVALGATAMEGLMGTTVGITRLRGTWKVYKAIPVMPTFHPAYLLRNPAAKREVWSDLQEVMKRLNKPLPRPRG